MRNAKAFLFALADIAEVKTFQLTLRDDGSLPRTIVVDLESFTAVQVEHAAGDGKACQFQAPASTEPRLLVVHRVEIKLQRQVGTAQVIGVKCWQVDA